MLEIKNITKIYKTRKKRIVALDNINYSFQNCGFYFINGKSGCGKTTLLNILCDLEKPSSGNIQKDNHSIGIVFQNDNLINNFTVIENLMIFSDDVSKINEYLTKFNLNDLKDTKVKYLSGGEKQRVSIIRCLIQNNNVLLLDEATANLDKEIAINILEVLKELSKEILIIFVSHDYDLISNYADIIIKMDSGKIIDEQITNQNNKTNSILTSNKKENKFKLKWILKYTCDILLSKKIMNFIGLIILSITMILIIISFQLKFFSTSDAISEALSNANYSYLSIKYSTYSSFSDTSKDIYKGDYLYNNMKEDYETYNYISTSNSNSELYISPEIYICDIDNSTLASGDSTGLVISSFLAEYYFGSDNPIGQILSLKFDDSLVSESNIDLKITGIINVDYDSNELKKYSSFESYRSYNKDLLERYYCKSYISKDYLINKVLNESVYIDGYIFNADLYTNEYFQYKTLIYNSKFYEEYNLTDNNVVISSKYKVYLGESIPQEYSLKNVNSSPNKNLYIDKINLADLNDKLNIIGYDDDVTGIIISEELYNEIINNYFNYFFSGIVIKNDNINKTKINKLASEKISFDLNEFYFLYSFSSVLKNELKSIVDSITILASIVVILFLLYSSLNIYNLKQKEIYVLKSFKVKKIKLLLPFLFNGIILFILASIISILCSQYTLSYLGSLYLTSNVNYSYHLLTLRFGNLMISLGFGLIFVLISVILPFIKINKNEVNIGLKNS